MKKLIACAIVCLVSLPAVGGDLTERLPAETIFLAQWHGRSLVFDGSLMGQMLLDPKTDSMMDFIRALGAGKNASPAEADLFESVAALGATAVKHPIGVAVMRLDPSADTRNQAATAVLLIDLGKDQPEFQKQLTEVLGDRVAFAPAQIAEVDCHVLQRKNAPPVVWGFIDSLFFLTVGDGAVEQLAGVSAGRSLADNDKYTRAMQPVGGENVQISLYLDVETLRGKAIQFEQALADRRSPPGAVADTQPTPSRTERIVDALGLSKMTTVAGTVRIIDKGMYTKIRIATPAPHTGLLKPLAGEPLTPADLRTIPSDADFAWVFALSPKAMLAAVREGLHKVDPGMVALVNGTLTTASEQAGFSIEQQLIDALGDTWSLVSAPSQGGTITGTVLHVEVDDPETFAQTLARLETLLVGAANCRKPVLALRTLRQGEQEIRYVQMQNETWSPVMPAWALREGRVYVALWPQVLATTFENTTPPLAGTDSWKYLSDRLTARPSSVAYVNTPAIARKAYPISLMLMSALSNAAGQIDGENGCPLLVSSLQNELKYLRPELSTVSHDEEGIVLEGYGATISVPLSAPAVGAGVLGAVLIQKARAVSPPSVPSRK